MTGIIVEPEGGRAPALNPRKEGSHYDSCVNPDCGRRDVEAKFRLGESRDGNQHGYTRSIYNCDPRTGGCGSNWTRAGAREVAEDHARGLATIGRTGSAMVERYTSVPSDAFRENYRRAFGHD